VIKATRYSRGGGADGVPWMRYIISKKGNQLARLLLRLPIHDPTNGFRAVKTVHLKGIPFKENFFSIIMEELYRLKPMKLRYAEIPVILTNRPNTLRGSCFSYRPRVFWDYLKYPIKCFFERH